MRTLSEQETRFLTKKNHCPVCNCDESLLHGPEGGTSQVFLCNTCGYTIRWNGITGELHDYESNLDTPLFVFLDDERQTPENFVRTYNVQQTIDLLKTKRVQILSLDHDLGFEDDEETGYDVLLWIEREVVMHDFKPPKLIQIHSANSGARKKMNQAVEQIMKLSKQND